MLPVTSPLLTQQFQYKLFATFSPHHVFVIGDTSHVYRLLLKDGLRIPAVEGVELCFIIVANKIIHGDIAIFVNSPKM